MFFNVNDLKGPTDEFFVPQIVGSFSLQTDKGYCNDLSQLKYYKEPENPNFDLNDNPPPADSQVCDEKMDFLLQWISKNFDQIKQQDSDETTDRWLKPEIVCYSDILATLLGTPYEKEQWIMCASKFKGTIYLCAFNTESKKLRETWESSHQKRCNFWDRKFKEYMLADSPNKDPDLPNPSNGNLCCMFESMFSDTVLLYGAEIDGIDSSDQITDRRIGENIELVELKTLPVRAISNYGLISYKRANTILKWWLRNYLAGIPHIICGCRNDSGIVTEIRKFDMDELEDNFEHSWNFERCTSFFTAFLERMKETVVHNYDECIYKFTYQPRKKTITVDELKPSPDLEFTFLHSWYIDAAEHHYKMDNEQIPESDTTSSISD